MRTLNSTVAAGLTLPWSQGVVEGTINKLKMVKRTMYGRAGLSLLTNACSPLNKFPAGR